MAARRRYAGSGLVISLLSFAIFFGAWYARQNIFDWARLYRYQPAAAISQLADKTTMTESTRRLFYVYHPVLGERTEFADECPSRGEQTIVLGCYVGGKQIYVFQVSDQRLKGVQEVTAAHETLHAAYARLSADTRQRIDGLTASALAASKDQRLISTIENYRQQDPSVVPNELHSILGTEVQDLPSELESYYRQYFTNRKQIVALSASYEQEFTRRRASIAASDQRLAALKPIIEANQAKISTETNELAERRQTLQQIQRSGDIEKYNAAVPGYNEQVRSYNALVVATQKLIDEYNQLVHDRNAVAVEEQDLFRALEGRPTTIEAQ